LVAAKAWVSHYPNKGLKNNEYKGILSIQVHEVDSFSVALQNYNLCKALYVLGVYVNTGTNYKKFGWIWILISPVLLIMALISTVESLTTYYIQLTCIVIIAILGFVSGIFSLFNFNWAFSILRFNSWLGFIYFSGTGAVLTVYSIKPLLNGNLNATLFMTLISFAIIATGLPFYFMAKAIGKRSPSIVDSSV
jgi:hypothetical protein